MTEFVSAIENGDLEKVKYFIEDEYADTRFAMEWAAKHGHLDIVKYISSLEPPGLFSWEKGNNCILEAAIYGHLDIVKYLVALGANLFQDYIISKCAQNGHIHILEYIVSLGGNILLSFDSIFWAASSGQVETLKYLVSQGANLRIENDTVVIWAASQGHLDVIMYLVSMGANVRTRDDEALRASAEVGYLNVIKYLISQGADVKNIPEDIFRIMSQDSDCFESVRYLISLGANVVNMIDEDCKRYIEFCEKMKMKIREKAQKKIYFWWIPICYDVSRDCGQRMMVKNWEKTQELFVNEIKT